MKIARFRTKEGTLYYGVVRNGAITVIKGDILSDWKETDRTVKLNEVKLLAPIFPLNLLALGRNYKEHAKEGGDEVPKLQNLQPA